MKLPNKHDLWSISFNHSSDILLRFYENLQEMANESYFFLVNDSALSSNHQLHLRNSLFNYISRKETYFIINKVVIMTTEKQIRKEIAKLSALVKLFALSSGKVDNYDYITGEEILPPD